MTNHGDTVTFMFGVNEADAPDEIEFSFDKIKFLLSEGQIDVDENGEYFVEVTQEMTFNAPDRAEYQLRVKKDGHVKSSNVRTKYLGPVMSRKVI